MSAAEIESALSAIAPSLKERLGVAALSVFGSAARGDDRPDSDIDILVDFHGPADFARYMDLKDALEAALGRPVDLVTRKAHRPETREGIEGEAVRVA